MMPRICLYLTIFTWFFCAVLSPAQAQNKIKAQIPNPYIADIQKQAEVLAKSLTPEQIDMFAILRENYGVLGSVTIVKGHISDTAALCSSAHPDLTDSLKTELAQWSNTVMPVVKDYESKVASYVNNKTFFDNPNQIISYFKLIDKAAEYADDQLVRKPVLTEKACKELRSSMKDTSAKIVTLLDKLTWPDTSPDGKVPFIKEDGQ